MVLGRFNRVTIQPVMVQGAYISHSACNRLSTDKSSVRRSGPVPGQPAPFDNSSDYTHQSVWSDSSFRPDSNSRLVEILYCYGSERAERCLVSYPPSPTLPLSVSLLSSHLKSLRTSPYFISCRRGFQGLIDSLFLVPEMCIDSRNWDEEAYRDSIVKARELQTRTVFRAIWAPSRDPNPDAIVVASSDGFVASYSISSCTSRLVSPPRSHFSSITQRLYVDMDLGNIWDSALKGMEWPERSSRR